MATNTKARELLWPQSADILVRAVFLYVGQGDSTIVFVKNGSDYEVLLVDINQDRKNGGIDVPRLVKDLLGGKSLYAFLNTHPHEDHVFGVGALGKQVVIDRVWHSGFSPGKDANPGYEDMKELIKEVKKRNGDTSVRFLRGSRSEEPLCDAMMHVLAPAEHVAEDIAEEDKDRRRALIHENCVVVKIGKESAWILLTGDADKPAFEKHITDYHKDRLGSQVLSASHHGSISFFKDKDDDEPYLAGLAAIDPTDVVLSAPTQKESKHGHPDSDAVELYEDHVGADHVYHTGDERYSFIVDILNDGTVKAVEPDNGELSTEYALDEEGGDDNGKGKGPFIRPKTATGDTTPRKFG